MENKLFKNNKRLTYEKKRAEIIVLFLINERKELLFKLDEMETQLNLSNFNIINIF